MTLKELESRGFTGPDNDLGTCLFDYGIAWTETPEETKVYFGITTKLNEFDEAEYSRFDWYTCPNTMNPAIEFSWAMKPRFFDYLGSTLEAWTEETSLPWKLFDLFKYYGAEEIFGTSYTEGFEITETTETPEA